MEDKNTVEEKAKVTVKIRDKEFPISNDSPDLKSILTYVIDNPDLKLDTELTIISEIESFDSDTLKKSLILALNDTIENIKINKERFEELLKQTNVSNG